MAKSPPRNGPLIAFTRDVGNSNSGMTTDIYVMRSDGSKAKDLTPGNATGDNAGPSWSPDGTKIAYSASHDPSRTDLYTLNADGSHQKHFVLSAPKGNVGVPAWSPDGTKIAFASDGGLYVVAVKGSAATQVTTGSNDTRPSWSPDGTKLAFTRDSGFWSVHMDGSSPSAIAAPAETDVNDAPSWSPDGTRIAFSGVRSTPQTVRAIFVMNADGSTKSRSPTRPGATTNLMPRTTVIRAGLLIPPASSSREETVPTGIRSL